MKPKLKFGNYVLLDGCIGVITNARTNQECYTVKWLYNPKPRQHYYQPVRFEEVCEVLPKDVAENLLEVLKRNEQ